MKNINVPEDLTTLSDDELDDLASQIREEGESIAADAATDDEALSELTDLVADFDRINDEITSREGRKAERAERAAAAMEKLQGDTTDENDDGEDVEDAPVAEVDEALPVAADVEDTEELASEDTAELTASADADEVAEAATETTEVEVSTPAQVEAPAETAVATTEDAVSDSLSNSTAVAAMADDRPDEMAPRAEESAIETGAALMASNAVPGVSEGTVLDAKRLAKAIADKNHGFGHVSAGTREQVVLATAQAKMPFKVGGSEEANFEVFEAIRKDWASQRSQATALVASGGVCAPLAPSYEFFRLAEELSPVEDALPVAEAPRGGIRFITPPLWTDAQAGVRVTTEDEDAAGYPPTAVKPCVAVECPPVEECRVDAVSQCVTFGNLNYRVFPEQVEAFLSDLAVAFTQVKEIHYIDAIDAASTAVTFAPTYSATRGITYTLLAAAANYRRRQHMSPEAVLTLFLPSWTVDLLKADLIADHSLGLNFIGATDAQVAQVFAGMNLDVSFYYESATGAGQSFNGAQGAGAMNEFPSTVVGYLFSPGTFVRLNAGTLDLGVVRDSVLNGTNDLQMFAEEWIQTCMVGLESLRLEITLCPDGTGPEPVTPLECGGASA